MHGQASVTVDHISGESLPVRVKEGSVLAAGSKNNDGVLVLKTTHTVESSTPSRIARLAIDARVRSLGLIWTVHAVCFKKLMLKLFLVLVFIETVKISDPYLGGHLPL